MDMGQTIGLRDSARLSGKRESLSDRDALSAAAQSSIKKRMNRPDTSRSPDRTAAGAWEIA
jgi:hypothetical protein